MNARAQLRSIPCRLAMVSLCVTAVAGCSKPAPPPAPPEPKAVENAQLELAVRPLPPGFEVAENAGDRLSFDALADGIPGSLAVTVGPPTPAGINLPAEAKSWGDAMAAAPGGRFFGGNQLVTPYGAAFPVRALVDGGATGERRVYLLHPGGGDRLVVLALRYPPGDAGAANARLKQLLDFLGALENFRAPAAPAAPPAAPPAR